MISDPRPPRMRGVNDVAALASPCPPAVCQAAREHLRALLRFDTTNPPGREGPAVDYCARVLSEAGFAPEVLLSPGGRPNLVVRHPGAGARGPLLVGAHLDVVEADVTRWTHPPFAAHEADGCLWGRGAIDMKNLAAMMLAILPAWRREGIRAPRDLIFAAVADEEQGCSEGSGFLVEEAPDLVRAEVALGEGGGFSIEVLGRRLYPIAVAEKGLAWVRVVAEGQPGHGSMPLHDSAVIKLARALERLGSVRLPGHPEVTREWLGALAGALPLHAGLALRLLLHDRTRDPILDRLLPPHVARGLAATLSNTVSPTVVRAGNKTNVIPGRAEAELDCRTLPGQSTQDLLRELEAVAGPDVRFEVLRQAPPVVTSSATDAFARLCAVVRRHDPDGVPVPSLCPGFTDAKSWSRLGAACYGFLPLRLPPGMRFPDLFHGDDERIPLDGLDWGTRVLWDALLEV